MSSIFTASTGPFFPGKLVNTLCSTFFGIIELTSFVGDAHEVSSPARTNATKIRFIECHLRRHTS